ncbi:MAG: fibronectin type III domain-containing protein [Pseudorhodobacter sp.]|nr:fibronectin type III domain-containing protein [Frankiaceae bacterium]
MTWSDIAGATGLTYTVTDGQARRILRIVALPVVGASPQPGVPSAATAPVTVVAPLAPRSVTAAPGYTSVLVSWAAPVSTGGSPVTHYAVTTSPKVGTATRTCSTAGARSCTVGGLLNGTRYSFAVSATSSRLTGPPSSPVTAVPRTFPGLVRSVTATFPAHLVSVVTWAAPTSTGGAPLLGYQVRWRPHGSSTFSAWSSTGLVRKATRTGLAARLSAVVQIRAVNAAGPGGTYTYTFTPTR